MTPPLPPREDQPQENSTNPPLPPRNGQQLRSADKRRSTRTPKGKKKKKESIFMDEIPALEIHDQVHRENTVVPVEEQYYEDLDNPTWQAEPYSYAEIRSRATNASRRW
jgi:hypothetical protein